MSQKKPHIPTIKPSAFYPKDETYFDDLESELLHRVRKGAFILDADIPLVFTVPDHYFQSLEQEVYQATTRASKEPLSPTFSKPWKPFYRIAAILVAILSMGYFISSWPFDSHTRLSVADIQEQEIIAYLESADIDEELFIDVFEDEIENFNIQRTGLGLGNNISEDDLQYFLDESDLLELQQHKKP